MMAKPGGKQRDLWTDFVCVFSGFDAAFLAAFYLRRKKVRFGAATAKFRSMPGRSVPYVLLFYRENRTARSRSASSSSQLVSKTAVATYAQPDEEPYAVILIYRFLHARRRDSVVLFETASGRFHCN
jgi:hypothetical protein